MASEFLPDNDPDLKLARRIGNYLNGTSSPDEEVISDPLVEILAEYKQHNENNFLEQPAPTQEIWEYINRKTRTTHITSRTPVTAVADAKSRTVWTTAAVIVIAAMLGIFYLTLPQSPDLLADAGPVIRTITLADGSEVTLRPNSTLHRINESDNSVSYRLSGEGYFNVIHTPDRIFSVEAGNGKVSVLGTRFNLSSWGDITQVYLEEGSIQFTHMKSRESVTLIPGQSLILTPDDTSVSAAVSTEEEEFTDWMRSQLVFDNKPAGYVFKELEHHFNIEISAPNEILTVPISSGGLTLEHEEASLEYLGLVLGGRFRSAGSGSYVFTDNE